MRRNQGVSISSPSKSKLNIFLLMAFVASGLTLASCNSNIDDGKTTTAFTVRFDLNGGSGTAPPSQKVKVGSSMTLPSGSGLSKTGFTFGGWNSNPEGTGTNYSAGSSYTITRITGDITLYAQWDEFVIVYNTVRFDGNGGDGTAPPTQIATAGSIIILPDENGLSKTGFTFGGWNTDPDGTGTNYSAGSFYTIAGTITLYAKWIAAGTVTYTVTFDANGGIGAAPFAQTVAEGSSITLPGGSGLFKPGFTFGGWNANADGTGTNYSAGSSYLVTKVTSDITLYAQWDEFVIVYNTVSFDDNGGDGAGPSAQTAAEGSSIILPNENGLSKPGFTFGGWNTDADGMGATYSAGSSYTVTGDITLYATWLVTGTPTYTVTFNNNGGIGVGPSVQTVAAGSSIVLPNQNELTKTGFTFGGWNTRADGTGTTYSAGSFYTVTGSPTGTITLYAMWIATGTVTYTVTFDGNGGSGAAPPSQTVAAGSSIVLPSGNELTKTGFIFGGWNTNAAGTGTTYSAGSFYTVTGSPTGTITLYAMWIAGTPTYMVVFNTNGGSGTAPPTQTVAAGSSIVLPSGSGLTKTDFIFGGWNTNTVGTGITYSAGSSYTVTSFIVLHAVWISDGTTYTVTFDSNSGSGTVPDAQTVISGTRITLPGGSELSKTGYTFDGWSTNPEGTGTNYWGNIGYTVTRDITLYARWLTNYTVTFDSNGGGGTVPDTQTVTSGTSITLPSGSGLSKTGYTFCGWNANADGTGATYSSRYTVTGDVTLYAWWLSMEGVVSATGVELVLVPGGSFQMGSDDINTGSSPVHTVTLTTFFMGKYEVTQAQYEAVMGSLPSSLPSSIYGVGDNYPVYYVSWYDALVFCNKLSIADGLTPAYRINNSTDPTDWGTVPIAENSTWNTVTINSGSTGYRLPTEAQWEYAAKGGNGSPGNYTYAGSDNPAEVAWYGGSQAHEVGTKAPNGLGLYDMSGNIWEWCWDVYGRYSSGAQTDPTGPSIMGSNRSTMIRGGNWYNPAQLASSVNRHTSYPNYRYSVMGFRIVRPVQ